MRPSCEWFASHTTGSALDLSKAVCMQWRATHQQVNTLASAGTTRTSHQLAECAYDAHNSIQRRMKSLTVF
jgi:hypothetical protein